MSFGFSTATKILFGHGAVGKFVQAAKELCILGKHALIVTGSSQNCVAQPESSLLVLSGSNEARANPVLSQLKVCKGKKEKV